MSKSAFIHAQRNKQQLEKERKENLRKLVQANEILQEVKREKKVSVSQLNVLRQQASLKERAITNIREELSFIQTNIQTLEQEQNALSQNLSAIKKEYAAMVYAASKANVQNPVIFLLASRTFNQFLMRLQYLKYYAEARRRQADQIMAVSNELRSKKEELDAVRQGKEVLLVSEQTEKQQLDALKEDQRKLVHQLSLQEEELRRKIEEHKAAVRKLERLISDLVKAEIRKSRAVAGPPSPKQDQETLEQKMVLTPEGRIISNSFAGNKGRFAWPVQNGFISSGFGRHEHPVLKRVYVENLGIDISTKSGEKVRSVFQGEVGLVGEVPGVEGKIVMIRHGEYFTVYSGLKNVKVAGGQKIGSKEVIGEVVRGDEEASILQFQIWKNNQRLNPEEWLAKD